jgi:hypothetical protein
VRRGGAWTRPSRCESGSRVCCWSSWGRSVLALAHVRLVSAVLFGAPFLVVELVLSALPSLRSLARQLGEMSGDMAGEPLGNIRGNPLLLHACRLAPPCALALGVVGVLAHGWAAGIVFGGLVSLLVLGFPLTLNVGAFSTLRGPHHSEMQRDWPRHSRDLARRHASTCAGGEP